MKGYDKLEMTRRRRRAIFGRLVLGPGRQMAPEPTDRLLEELIDPAERFGELGRKCIMRGRGRPPNGLKALWR